MVGNNSVTHFSINNCPCVSSEKFSLKVMSYLTSIVVISLVIFSAATVFAEEPAYEEWKQRGITIATLKKNQVVTPSKETFLWAESGDPEAQFLLGFAYFKGTEHLEKNQKKGLGLILKSAKSGFGKAQNTLGNFYAEGAGVKQDWSEAYFWDSLAAKSYYDPGVASSAVLSMGDDLRHLSSEEIATVNARLEEWRPLSVAGINLDKIEGRYLKIHENGNIDGDRYQTENILEIVKYAPDKAYVRTKLSFFNGHGCGLAGIAEVHGNELIYQGFGSDTMWEVARGSEKLKRRDGREKEYPLCKLRVGISAGKISFHDDGGACYRYTCGMRGGYNRVSFDREKRRKISYMGKILASDEYASATREYGKNKEFIMREASKASMGLVPQDTLEKTSR